MATAGLVPDGLPNDVLELFRTNRNFEIAMAELGDKYDSRQYTALY
jgi:hypothetical protein